jgi:hypothetical protein
VAPRGPAWYQPSIARRTGTVAQDRRTGGYIVVDDVRRRADRPKGQFCMRVSRFFRSGADRRRGWSAAGA